MLPSIKEVDVAGKRVLLRAGLNVTIENGKIVDDYRLREILPTIQYLIDNRAKTVILTHLGRPKGKRVAELSVDPIAHRLTELLGREVRKLDDVIGLETEMVIALLKPGDVVLLENVRFHPEEEAADLGFARAFGKFADIYVNEAFADSASEHASITRITELLPSYAGLNFEKEIHTLNAVMASPQHPFVLLLGGAKVSDKVPLLRSLLPKADKAIIAGAMANTFLKAKGIEIGQSTFEDTMLDVAQKLMEDFPDKIVLPQDLVVGQKDPNATHVVIDLATKRVNDGMILDIGPHSVQSAKLILSMAKTVLWNGPCGLTEIPKYADATIELAKAISRLDAKVVVGGGDTSAFLEQYKIKLPNAYVSTGGRAMLKFLGGEKLPGVRALEDSR
jgi:phosphoglycerate kinase